MLFWNLEDPATGFGFFTAVPYASHTRVWRISGPGRTNVRSGFSIFTQRLQRLRTCEGGPCGKLRPGRPEHSQAAPV